MTRSHLSNQRPQSTRDMMQLRPWAQARKGRGACPYLTGGRGSKGGSGGGGGGVAHLTDAILAAPQDVEDLAAAGRRRGACPYYATRRAAPHADLLLVPYPSLLLKACSLLTCVCVMQTHATVAAAPAVAAAPTVPTLPIFHAPSAMVIRQGAACTAVGGSFGEAEGNLP